MAQTCMGDIRCRAATAIGVAAAALSLLLPSSSRAGFTTSETLNSSSVGKSFANQTIYVVDQNLTLSRSPGSSNSALYIANNATTVLYIKSGVTLTVRGGDASGTEGAGAGIRLNDGSTLVVTSGGTLNVTGGDAALLPRGDVGVTVNPDGTATLAVPHTDAPSRFFRVETE